VGAYLVSTCRHPVPRQRSRQTCEFWTNSNPSQNAIADRADSSRAGQALGSTARAPVSRCLRHDSSSPHPWLLEVLNPPASMGSSRQRLGNGKAVTDGEARGPKAVSVQMVRQTGPSLVAVLVMLAFIFGGCCSNVSQPFSPCACPCVGVPRILDSIANRVAAGIRA
jgi:hypothetical protein